MENIHPWRHLGPYLLKSFEHAGMFKTYQKVEKQVWFYLAMLLIVSCHLLQTVGWLNPIPSGVNRRVVSMSDFGAYLA